MQADIFYSSNKTGALPIYLISTEQWQKQDFNASTADQLFLKAQQFTGKLGDVCIIYNQNGIDKVFIGGNCSDDFVLAQAVSKIPPGLYQLADTLSHWAFVNWSLAQYRFDRYKKNAQSTRVLYLCATQLPPILTEANVIFFTRDLINTPTNDLGPTEFADICAELAKTNQVIFKQWIGEELLSANFPAIHAVGRAALDSPRLLHLHWGNAQHPRLALVGKGVCFDSGGLNIKPSSGMRWMKKDMGGAANVLGLARWIMDEKLPICLDVYIPAIENAVGSRSFRPGDVLTMRNKLTVEIDNTDAEGRLILADALVLALENKPDLVIDFATLTGAARVAVGTEIAAMFCNQESLAMEVLQAAKKVNDPVWQLPLFSNYENNLDSSIADLANSSASSYAGAITAALFLQRFMDSTTPWIHFDIMAWNVSSKPGKPEGGEAMAIRAIFAMLQNWAKIS